jgi:hypothetical protein
MSHISKVEVEVRDLAAVEAMCAHLGWTLVRDQKTYRWFGRFMYDTPLPPGLKVEDLGKCTHAIKVPGCNYEIGLVATQTGYRVIFDYYEPELTKALGGREAPLLKREYAIAAVRRQAQKMGKQAVVTRGTDGRAKVVIRG